MNELLQPHYLVPIGMILLALVSGFVGWLVAPWKTKYVPAPYVPKELTRLASAFKITTDIHKTQSYGRLYHDLIRDKDMEINDLRASMRDLTETDDRFDSRVTTLNEILHGQYLTGLEHSLAIVEGERDSWKKHYKVRAADLRAEQAKSGDLRTRLDQVSITIALSEVKFNGFPITDKRHHHCITEDHQENTIVLNVYNHPTFGDFWVKGKRGELSIALLEKIAYTVKEKGGNGLFSPGAVPPVIMYGDGAREGSGLYREKNWKRKVEVSSNLPATRFTWDNA